MRILGLDFGSRTCGVAVTDALGLTAQGVEVIRRPEESKLRPTYRRIDELIEAYGVEKIVVGYPRHMDGTEGERCEKSAAFAKKLEGRTHLPVILWDERLTTVEAHELMMEAGMSREEREQVVDKVAATLILEDYLNAQERDQENG